MKQIPIKVKKTHPDAVLPFYARQGDAGMDLVAVEDAVIYPGDSATISTGLAMAIPEGYELQIRPRSGMSAKTKLRISNSPGTIDSNFRGTIGILVDNIAQTSYQLEISFDDGTGLVEDVDLDTREELTWIYKGDRIAQAVLNEVPTAVLEEVDELDETVRGANGFGSSGSSVYSNPYPFLPHK